jgi:DNA-binding GntR family transcriptional regulator
VVEIGFPIERPDPKLISHQIFERLRNAIIQGKFQEGQRIIETDLTKALGVSRSPIREALRMLAMEGFVNLIPYRGATVSGFRSQDVKEHFEIKAMVEGFAAYLGAQRFGEKEISDLQAILAEMGRQVTESNLAGVLDSNFAFHRKIIENVKNSRLTKFYESLTHSIRRYGTIGLTNPSTREIAVREHEEIFDAIREKNPVLAEERARRHALSTIERVLANMGRQVDDAAG